MAKLARMVCKILGVLFFVVGVSTFMFGEDGDWYHNLLHFATGLIALYFGFAGALSAAKIFCLVFGVAYLGFGILGFAMGNPAMDYMWNLRLMHLAMAEHLFHITLGAIILAGGIFTRRDVSQSSTGSEKVIL